MRYFIKTDPGKFLIKINSKVLALNGEKDIQVSAQQNISAIKSALNKSGSKIHNEKNFSGHNHLFQKCSLCTMDEYALLEESFSLMALEEISRWLEKNVINPNYAVGGEA